MSDQDEQQPPAHVPAVPMNPIEDVVNKALVALRQGGGDAIPEGYFVMLINDDTKRAIIIAAMPTQPAAAHFAAVVDKALHGKHVGFRCRCEAVAVAAKILDPRIHLTGH